MLLLRVGRKARWGADRRADDPEHVVDAARDLTLSPDDVGLSVYHVEGDDDARDLAIRYALTYRENVVHMDYVVFPAELATSLGLSVGNVPAHGLDSRLNARHHEIVGLTPELQLRLAAAILASDEARVARIPERELPKLGAEHCRRDPELRNHLKGNWATKLQPLLDEPTPEE